MLRQKFENDVLVPTSVADGFLQHALDVGDLQDQLTQQDIITRHLPTYSLLFQCLIMDNNPSPMDSQQPQLTSSTEDS